MIDSEKAKAAFALLWKLHMKHNRSLYKSFIVPEKTFHLKPVMVLTECRAEESF